NFDPEDEYRDYDQVARELPVFCVSSRGYQKLKCRLRKDGPVTGFQDIAETEILMLQQHCRKLTEAARVAGSQRFLNNLFQLANGLTLWLSGDDPRATMTREQKTREEQALENSLETLKSGLARTVTETTGRLSKVVSDGIFNKYGIKPVTRIIASTDFKSTESAVSSATCQAIPTVQKWAMPVNRTNPRAGGYWHSTYKAICRRNGVYKNFHASMTSFADEAVGLLSKFHQTLHNQMHEHSLRTFGLSLLRQQLAAYTGMFKDCARSVRESVIAAQKNINREFVPVIEGVLVPTYEACFQESGLGGFARMKRSMEASVSEKRFTMFQESVDEVRKRLLDMIKAQEQSLAGEVESVVHKIRRDYASVFAGNNAPKGHKPQQSFRVEIMKILDDFDKTIQAIADQEESTNRQDENSGNGVLEEQ
ncbi:MAG: hypothetical protein Q9181_008075, partial [Wetmoreana brouardii]